MRKTILHHRTLDTLSTGERLAAGRMILANVSTEIIARTLHITRLQAQRIYETYYTGYGGQPWGPLGRCGRCGNKVILPCRGCDERDRQTRKQLFRHDQITTTL
jgi:hypothetical protein